MRTRCGDCNQPLQATAPVWLTIDDEGSVAFAFEVDTVSASEIRWYCPNDHRQRLDPADETELDPAVVQFFDWIAS